MKEDTSKHASITEVAKALEHKKPSKWDKLLEAGLFIGPYLYHLQDVEGLANFGEVIESAVVISIRDNLGQQTKVQIVLHEIIHTLLTQSGRIKETKDEGLVDSLAYGLYQVIRDNPGLVAVLVEDDRLEDDQ